MVWVVNPEGECWWQDDGPDEPDDPETPRADDPADGPSRADEKQRTSERRIAANRENAKKSTGPRTDAGKARSSRNAERHGGLSTLVQPISSGPFAEDPSIFYEEVERLVHAFQPVGIVEEALASRIAGCLIKLGRIDRWVVASIEDPDDWHLGFFSGRTPAEKVATKILAGPMELDRKYHQRAVRDLVTLLAQLTELQELRRPSGTNEPNES